MHFMHAHQFDRNTMQEILPSVLWTQWPNPPGDQHFLCRDSGRPQIHTSCNEAPLKKVFCVLLFLCLWWLLTESLLSPPLHTEINRRHHSARGGGRKKGRGNQRKVSRNGMVMVFVVVFCRTLLRLLLKFIRRKQRSQSTMQEGMLPSTYLDDITIKCRIKNGRDA